MDNWHDIEPVSLAERVHSKHCECRFGPDRECDDLQAEVKALEQRLAHAETNNFEWLDGQESFTVYRSLDAAKRAESAEACIEALTEESKKWWASMDEPCGHRTPLTTCAVCYSELRERVEALEDSEAQAVGFADDFEARVEALVEVLRSAPEPPQLSAGRPATDVYAWLEDVFKPWLAKRAAALAERKP